VIAIVDLLGGLDYARTRLPWRRPAA